MMVKSGPRPAVTGLVPDHNVAGEVDFEAAVAELVRDGEQRWHGQDDRFALWQAQTIVALRAELAQAREEIESQRVQLEANHEWEACAENELAQAKEEIERLKEQVATEASMAATDPELRYVAKEAVKRHLAARKAGGGE